MKHLRLFTITLLWFVFSATAYSQTKLYFDENWKETTKENAHFYRVTTKKNDSLFHIKDYYINDVLQMDGHFSDMENETLEGKVNFYTSEGKIFHSETYSKGVLHGLTTVYLKNGQVEYTSEYVNGKIYNGVYKGAVTKRYYKNGEIIKDVEYSPPNPNYILKTTFYGKEIDSVLWHTATGQQLGVGTFKDFEIINGLNILNMLDETVHTYYKNGLREGVQKVYNSNGKLTANMTYTNNKLILDETLNPLTNKFVSCTYKDNEPFNGRYFQYKPMYAYYDEYVFENGVLKTHNRYSEDKDGKIKLLE